MIAALEAGNPSAAAFFRFQAFTTAAVQDSRVRAFMKESLAANLDRGEGAREFKKVVDNSFDLAGLTRLAPHQINNIYETNASLAFAGGQMQKMIETADDFPFWKFSATLDSKTRPSHAALHGKIFRVGDYTFFPPLSFRCRCTAIPMTARQAGRYLKTDMPTGENKKNLYNLIENKAFAGNKQQKFMEWAAKEYKEADEPTRRLIDKALDTMRSEISKLKPSRIPFELLEDSDYLKDTNIQFKEELFRMIDPDKPVKLVIEKQGKGSNYNPNDKTVHIVDNDRNEKSPWHKESVIYHEFGHAIDGQRGLNRSEEASRMLKSWQKELNKKQANGQPEIAAVSQKLDNIYRRIARMDDQTIARMGITKADIREQITATQDTLKAINPRYGYGHSDAYFRAKGFREAEFIAHCFENKFAGNRIFQKYLPELYQDMIKYVEKQQ